MEIKNKFIPFTWMVFWGTWAVMFFIGRDIPKWIIGFGFIDLALSYALEFIMLSTLESGGRS